MADGEDDPDLGVLLRFTSGLAVTVGLIGPLGDPQPGD
jgi:hypothetical protein